MDDERAPDQTQDPREQGVAESGYPETNPEGATPPGDAGRSSSGGDSGSGAPSTSTGKEADRDASTGNPDAAG